MSIGYKVKWQEEDPLWAPPGYPGDGDGYGGGYIFAIFLCLLSRFGFRISMTINLQ